MKLQINITETTKEVIVEESCNLKELSTFMQVSFPDYYHEFKVVPKIIQNFGAPIIINPYTLPYYRQPWYGGFTTTESPFVGSAGLAPSVSTLNKGSYNVEVLMRGTEFNKSHTDTYVAGVDPFKTEGATIGEILVYKRDLT